MSDVERALVEHVESGDILDLVEGETVDEATMRSWDKRHTVRASVIRDIVRGHLAHKPDPHGIRLRGARIDGRLDLMYITSKVALELLDCLLEEGLDARHADLTVIRLTACRLEHRSEPAFDGRQLNATLLNLDRASIVGNSTSGAITLGRARIDGALFCNGTNVRNDSGPALAGDGMNVAGPVLLRFDFSATGSSERGAVRLFGAQIGLGLECDGAQIHNDEGPAFSGERMRVDGPVFLRRGFAAVGSGKQGTIRLREARIGGELDCAGATVHNQSGPALVADKAQIDGPVYLRKPFTARVSVQDRAAVSLVDTKIGGGLECDGAEIHNTLGSALDGEDINVKGPVLLRDGFIATGAGQSGAVRFFSARIGSALECNGAKLHNGSGPAFYGSKMQVDGEVHLCEGFTAISEGDGDAVRITGAKIGGSLHCRDVELRNDSGCALQARQTHIGQAAFLGPNFSAVGGGTAVTINLTDVKIEGALVFSPSRLEHRTKFCHLIYLDGLTYSGLPRGGGIENWLRLLREGTPEYAAQPYQQLAAAQRAAGHDGAARKVLMAQRRDQIDRRALTGSAERGWARLTGLTLGYGYQPWRAIIGLLVVIGIAVVLAVVLGGRGGLAHPATATQPATPCTAVERVGVGLDLGTPLLATTARARCEATNTAAGTGLAITGWLLRLLAWAFATLFIAGFTGAVRKT